MWFNKLCIFIAIFSASNGNIIIDKNWTADITTTEDLPSTPQWPETTTWTANTTTTWTANTTTTEDLPSTPQWPETTTWTANTTTTWTANTTTTWTANTTTTEDLPSTPQWPETTTWTVNITTTEDLPSTPQWPETTTWTANTTTTWTANTTTTDDLPSTPQWPETTTWTANITTTEDLPSTPQWLETTTWTANITTTEDLPSTPQWPETSTWTANITTTEDLPSTPQWPETSTWTANITTTEDLPSTPQWPETSTWTANITTTEELTTEGTTTTIRQPDIYYLLYNRYVSERSFTSLDYDIPLDPNVGTVIIIHEHRGFAGDRFTFVLRRAFERYHNLNVFIMNWMTLSMEYEEAVANYQKAAKDLVKFLETLRHIKAVNNNQDLHIIGFGIGAHLAGVAGNLLKDIAQVGRISGLSPSETETFNYTHILSKSDAGYVEVIHTNNDELGYGINRDIGHVDFYPNGGSRQTGCWSHRCSHERAFELFEASLEFDHLVGQRCIDFYQMHDNTCNGLRLHLGGAEVMKVPMLPGIYRLDTGPTFPFKIQNVTLV